MFAFAICAVMVILALGQAAWHWHGTRSAIALAVGTTAGLALVMSLPRLKGRSTASYQSALSLGSTLGGLAVIPTLVFVRVSEPGPLLGVTQALADGYVAGQFAALTRFIRRPWDESTRA